MGLQCRFEVSACSAPLKSSEYFVPRTRPNGRTQDAILHFLFQTNRVSLSGCSPGDITAVYSFTAACRALSREASCLKHYKQEPNPHVLPIPSYSCHPAAQRLQFLFALVYHQGFAQTRCYAPSPLSVDAEAGLPIPDVANQQGFLGAVLDRTHREVQLVGEVQDSSGTYSSDWHQKLLPFSDANELVEIILQAKKQSQHAMFSDSST